VLDFDVEHLLPLTPNSFHDTKQTKTNSKSEFKNCVLLEVLDLPVFAICLFGIDAFDVIVVILQQQNECHDRV